jgi:hypothetical protein
MEITFPVLVLSKDSGDILKFESHAAMQSYMERIDVNNNEYAAWDATGHVLSLVVQEPVWLKVVWASQHVDGPDLSDSLKRFAQLREVILADDESRLDPVALYNAIAAKSRGQRKLSGLFRPRK